MNDGFSSFNRKIAPSLKIMTIIAFLIIIILTIPSINAVDLPMQGPNSPGTVANDNSIGTIPWVNPGNATTSDDADATCTLSYTGNYLKATNFGFAIPADATINGILVEFEKDQDGPMNALSDNAVRIVKGGVIGSTDRKLVGDCQLLILTLAMVLILICGTKHGHPQISTQMGSELPYLQFTSMQVQVLLTSITFALLSIIQCQSVLPR